MWAMHPSTDLEHRIAGIAALDQPLRRDLYRLLSDRDGWTTRDEAAEALGVARSVAAFHLDKLADAGVLEVTYQRTTGRTGPGAGRPAEAVPPERRRGVRLGPRTPLRPRRFTARDRHRRGGQDRRTHCGLLSAPPPTPSGARSGRNARRCPPLERGDDRRQAVLEVLARHGYQPELGDHDEIALANCPFHRLAEEHRTLVCGMNLDFLRGLLEGMGTTDQLAARLAPEPGYCCVRIAAA